jgi:hypothetical protein
MNFLERTINRGLIKFKENDTSTMNQMFSHGLAEEIKVDLGIQLCNTERHFPGSLWTLMIEFQAAVDNPILVRKNIPEFS